MGLFIHSGQETQIAIYPQVTYTTNDAIGKTVKNSPNEFVLKAAIK